jgi:hypothetical protein
VKVGVEVPQNIDDGGVKGKPRISPFL